jgi:predicted N-formylglutamate amidohydrolase
MHEAWEGVGDPRSGPFVFTCEHATNRLPEWEVAAGDRAFLEDHWGWDVGAADLTRALARETRSAAVLSRFSRLVCDPNRRPDEPSFVVPVVDGHVLALNRAVDDAERARRRARYFDPYHDAIDRVLAERRSGGPGHLCSIHSFTPTWEGRPREMEVGVLYDAHEDRARALAASLEAEGFVVAHNEPYSGYAGLIYAASRHGRAHGVPYVEVEVRSDLIDTPARAAAVAVRVARALRVHAPEARPAAADAGRA